ncbi:hypothetical protein [Pedobacter terrae]|uniref:hypothetical protein n=1 Tax=Pedobacter terrae TaxID=405671 RepID=UPI002FF91DD6
MDSRIIYLFIKYLNGECNQAEQDQVTSILKSGGYEAEWELALSEDADKLMDEPHETNIPEHEADRIYTAVEDNLFIEAHSGSHSGRNWTRYGLVACAIVLIAFVSKYFLTEIQAPADQVTVKSAVHDLAPGSDKAILTLADGRKVVLNGSATGKVADQAGVEIDKTAEGMLVYENELKATGTMSVTNTVTIPRGGKMGANIERWYKSVAKFCFFHYLSNHI